MESYFDRYIAAGGIMMVLLIPCSLFAIAYMVQGFINLRRSRLLPPAIEPILKDSTGEVDPQDAVKTVVESNTVLGRIVIRVLQDSSASHISSEDLNEITSDEIGRLYQQNSQLSVIYTIAPLLGLLGTILGMMKSFYLFSMMENPSVSALSRGINEALVTTMWGLFIAIPSFLVLNLFRYQLLSYQREVLPVGAQKIIRILASHPVEEKSDESERESEPASED